MDAMEAEWVDVGDGPDANPHVDAGTDDGETSVLVSHKQIPNIDPGDDFKYTAMYTHTIDKNMKIDDLYVDVIVDKSHSMGNNLQIAKNAVVEMIDHMNNRSGCKLHVRVSGFATDFVVHSDGYVHVCDDSIASLKSAVNDINNRNGSTTNISLAMENAMKGLSEKIASSPGAQGYVIILTDGQANQGEYSSNRIHNVVYANARGQISVGAIALGNAPKKDYMEELTKGGKFFYAPTAKDLNSAYEEVESGFLDVVRHCKISAMGHVKYGSGSPEDTISLVLDISHAELMMLPERDGKRILSFDMELDNCITQKTIEIPTGDTAIEELPPEIVAHRELLEANRAVQEAIQSAANDGADAAIGRLVTVAETVNVIGNNAPGMVGRARSMQHAVERATVHLRSLSSAPASEPHVARQDAIRNVRQRSDTFYNDDEDCDLLLEPSYRSCSASMPQMPQMPLPQASLDLISGEASSQMHNF